MTWGLAGPATQTALTKAQNLLENAGANVTERDLLTEFADIIGIELHDTSE